MKTKRISLILLGVVLSLLAISCKDMPIGYLQADKAFFSPDTVYVYKQIDPQSDRAKNNSPWTSLRIQGISGTAPINYEFYDVKVNNGGNAATFKKLVDKKKVLIQGGIIQLFQDGVKELPNGDYTISMKVYNEGYSNILKDIFTFVVKDEE